MDGPKADQLTNTIHLNSVKMACAQVVETSVNKLLSAGPSHNTNQTKLVNTFKELYASIFYGHVHIIENKNIHNNSLDNT